VSAWPSFFDTGRAFALRADLQAGPSQAHIEGTLVDLMQLAQVDVGVQLKGPRVADLAAVAGLKGAARSWPALPSQASAQLHKQGARWNVSALQARVGRSDLAGSFDFVGAQGADGRSTLQAKLSSERIDIKGWRAARPADGGASAPSPEVPNRLDADVDLQVATIEGALPVALTAFAAHATQREGRVALDAMQFALAGGRASGSLAVDTARAPAAYALDLRLQGVQLTQLARSAAPAAPAAGTLSGGLNARLALRSQGDTPAALAAALAGTVGAELVRASIPDALDAKLALDGGHLLRSMFGGGKERAPVTCAVLDLRFAQGRGELRRFAFETGSVSVGGTGWVDLGRQSVELLLTPHRKQSALLALDRSMRFSGPLASPKLALADRAAAGPVPAPCATSAVQ
jgi:AsmA family protein